MEEQNLPLLPNKFSEFFQKEIREIDPEVQIDQQESYYQEIYICSFDSDKMNEAIYSKLAKIGLSDEKSMNSVVNWLKRMKESFKKFDQLNKNNMKDLSQQTIIDQKFDNFIDQNSKKKKKKNDPSPQQNAKRQKFSQSEISELKRELNKIRAQTNQKQCIQTIVRQIAIALYEENSAKIRVLVPELRNMVGKYRLKPHCFPDIQQVEQDIKNCWDRLPKISTIKKKLYVLNLVEIFEGKVAIMSDRAHKCKDAEAILVIGLTGAGKSTLVTALSGSTLKYSSDTKDYRASNPDIARLIPVSNSQQSQTRWANVIQLALSYSGGKKIILIDSPGFQDNRGEQTEITNNLVTVNLIKKLNSARIIIVIPKEQFYGDKQIENYCKFIKLFAGYFSSVYDFQDSISLVLTKGLTAQELLNTILEVQSTSTFLSKDWSENQKYFQVMIKDKLQKLKEVNQIKDPSTHKFASLMIGVMKQKSKALPGNQITSSPSQSSINSIRETYVYLQKMVRETFQQGEFFLTRFYLNNLKQLEQIQKNGTFQASKKQMKQQLGKNLKKFELILERYLTSCDESFLKQLMEIYDFFSNKESQSIYQILYMNENHKEKTPKELCSNLLEETILKTKKLFDNNEKIKQSNKKRVKSSLILMNKFGYESYYQDIHLKIENQEQSATKQFKEILEAWHFDEGRWKNAVISYMNQFRQDQKTSSQKEKYEGILQFILSYINSNPRQLQEIKRLLTIAMTQSLDGKLEQICGLYIGKLIKMKQTHYIIKQALEPKVKEIFQKLDAFIVEYEEKFLNNTTICIEDLDKWQIYGFNLIQTYEIKRKFEDSIINDITDILKHKAMYSLFFNNLQKNINALQKQISVLPQNPQQINPEMIEQKLQTIFKLLVAMEKKKNSSPKQEKSKKMEYLTEILDSSLRKINSIITFIQRVCSRQHIRNFELNLKLMNSLTLVQQFKVHVQEQKMKAELQKLQNKIESKILSPLELIEKDQFKNQFAFQKLLKILRYMKCLDQETINLSSRAKAFNFLINLKENREIEKVLDKCLERVRIDFKSFEPIIELSLYGAKRQHGEKKQQQFKNACIEKLNYNLSQRAISYIKCFDFVMIITNEFKTQLPIIQNFMRSQLHQSDLKRIIKDRINTIGFQLSSKLQIQEIDLIKKEFNILNRIYEKTKTQNEMDYKEIEEKIQKTLKTLCKNFGILFDLASSIYKDVYNIGQGVEYQTLRQLVQHDGINVGDCKDLLRNLLITIDQQYIKKLKDLYINFDYNDKMSEFTEIFLNIFEFIDICKSFNYKYKFDDHLLYENLENFFCQLKHGFDNILQDFTNGIPIEEQKVKQLLRYEKKILLSVKAQYLKFIEQNGIRQLLSAYYQKKRKFIHQNILGKYLSKDTTVFDQNFKIIHFNTSPINRELMKKAAIEKNKKDIEENNKFIEIDHQKLDDFIDKRFKELQNLPQQISELNIKQLTILQRKQKGIEDQNIIKLQKAIEQKQSMILLDFLIKGKNIKNKRIKDGAIEGFKQYFKGEEKELDLNSLEKFEKVLIKNIEFSQKPTFQQACKSQNQISFAYSHFMLEVKSRVHQGSKIWQKDIKELRSRILSRLQNQKVELYNFKLSPSQQKLISRGSDMLKLVKKFEFYLKEEVQELRGLIDKKIIDENLKIKQSICELEELKNKLIGRRNIIKQEFTSKITQALISREICIMLSNFSNIPGIKQKIACDEIKDNDRVMQQMKEDLRKKYQQAINWKLQDFISNESNMSNSTENQQNERALQILNNMKDVFFSSSQMAADVIKTIQNDTKQQFQDFQQKALEDIDKFFNPSVECKSERISQYYTLVSKIKQTKSIRFPLNVKIVNKARDKLLMKFKQNVKTIECFIEQKQKLKKYDQFFGQLNKLGLEEQKQIDKLKEQAETKKAEERKTLEAKLQVDKKAITRNDDEKETKLKAMENQFDANLEVKCNSIMQNLSNLIKKVQGESTKKKNVINTELNDFLEEELVRYLVVFQRAITYFYCEQDIQRSGYSVSQFLTQLQKKYKKKILRYIYSILKNSQSNHAQTITSQKCFDFISKSNWLQLVNGSKFDKLMEKIPQLKNNQNTFKLFLIHYNNYQD